MINKTEKKLLKQALEEIVGAWMDSNDQGREKLGKATDLIGEVLE